MAKQITNDLVIIGGGITGLAAAYIAAKNNLKVTVIEAAPKVGGLLNTFSIGGNQLEFYYHHFFTHDAEIQWLCQELGLEKKLLFKKTSMGFFRNNQIYNFNSPIDLLSFKPLNLIDKLRFGLTSLYLGKIAIWRNYENTSALEWFYKYAGKGTTNSIWKPMLEIKFGPYAKDVPVTWMIGRLAQRMNSRQKADETLGYIQGSWQTLLTALVKHLTEMNVTIVTDTKVEKLNLKKGVLTSIKTSHGIISGKKFLSTIPTKHLVSLVKPVNPRYASKLDKIEYFGAVCTILELTKKLSDIYWLNVADPGYPFGGVIEHTNFIPASKYQGSHIVYLSRYFAMSDPIAKASNTQIKKQMLTKLKLIFPKLNDKKIIKKVYIFKTYTAATVCDKNFSKKIPNCKSPIKNLYIAAMPHIYPDERSTNNSIRIAAEACRVMKIKSDFVPKNASLSGQIGMD